jgi:hypothetical protein
MIQRFQNLNLPNGRDGESILFFFGIDSFQGNNFTGLFIGSYKDTPLLVGGRGGIFGFELMMIFRE